MEGTSVNNTGLGAQAHDGVWHTHLEVEPPQLSVNTVEKTEALAPIEMQSSSCPKCLRISLATFAANLGAVSMGAVEGYTSPAILDINSYKTIFHLNTLEMSLAVGTMSLGSLLGAPFGGHLVDRYGRKHSIMLTITFYAFAWIFIVASPNVYCLCVGRFLTGFCTGIMNVAVPAYITEIAAPQVRGFMGSCYELGCNLGQLYVFAFGCFLHWNWLAVACLCVSLVQILLMLPMPETPRWLVSKGHRQEAFNSLNWLRNDNCEAVMKELLEIEKNIQKSSREVKLGEFCHPPLFRAIWVVIGLVFFMLASGDGAIPFYLAIILNSTGLPWNPYLMSAVYGTIGFVSNVVAAVLVDRAGRRVMLMVSSLGMTLGMSGLASFFTVKHFTPTFDAVILSWLPIAFLALYNFSLALGYGPITFYLASEIFPLRARGLAIAFAMTFLSLFQLTINTTFPYLIIAVSNRWVFWIFAIVSFLSGVFAFFFVPETKGKSLEEIEKQMRSSLGF